MKFALLSLLLASITPALSSPDDKSHQPRDQDASSPPKSISIVHAGVSLDNPSNITEAILDLLPESGPRFVTHLNCTEFIDAEACLRAQNFIIRERQLAEEVVVPTSVSLAPRDDGTTSTSIVPHSTGTTCTLVAVTVTRTLASTQTSGAPQSVSNGAGQSQSAPTGSTTSQNNNNNGGPNGGPTQTAQSSQPTSSTPSQPPGQQNYQTFSSSLGGTAPAVTLSNGQYVCDGSSFSSLQDALQRSCNDQHNACADTANTSKQFTVTQCDQQQTSCVNAIPQ